MTSPRETLQKFTSCYLQLLAVIAKTPTIPDLRCLSREQLTPLATSLEELSQLDTKSFEAIRLLENPKVREYLDATTRAAFAKSHAQLARVATDLFIQEKVPAKDTLQIEDLQQISDQIEKTADMANQLSDFLHPWMVPTEDEWNGTLSHMLANETLPRHTAKVRLLHETLIEYTKKERFSLTSVQMLWIDHLLERIQKVNIRHGDDTRAPADEQEANCCIS